MKVLELFAGTRSIGRAFAGGGHDVYSIEWDDSFPDISWYMDISKITSADILERFGKPDVIWASPDCTTYSIAGISHHRVQEPNGNLAPVSEYAKFCDTLNRHGSETGFRTSAHILVHRESPWRDAKNGLHERVTPLHPYLLPIR